MTLHGPHHVVAKSTTTSLSVFWTMSSKACSEPISVMARHRVSRERLTARPLMAGAGVHAAPLHTKASAATTLLAVFMAAPSLQLRLHWLYIYRAVTQTSHCVIAVATGRLSARQDC